MKILVSGGLGFVGSHLVDLLMLDSKNKVVVIDNLSSESSSRDYMRDDVTYWIDDIRNLNTQRYENKTFDIIYHLGALARIQPSFKDPLTHLSINIMGSSHVLEFARKKSSKVIYAGSSSAFGDQMLNPYTFTKYTGEQICELYSRVYGLSTVVARFFNVYGDRQPITGPYATVIGVFEEQTKNTLPLTVTGTGEQRRDFTHVSDIAAGLVALSEDAWQGEVFQLGTGVNYSINDLANMFGGEIKYIPLRPGETWITLADISDTIKHVGWTPKINLLDYVSEWKMKNLGEKE
jgi:UDP-glucose 4-epimerase